MKKAMRSLLLAGVAAATLTAPMPAHALLGVGDVVFDPTANATQLEQYASQLRQAATELQQLEQTVATYEHLVQNATRLGTCQRL
jgi:P-type conjugative transfer protein TrbJ